MMTNPSTTNLPLVYACSGCSNIAQLANDVAIALDRTGKAEMSCIAGVGGGVLPLIKKAQSGRHIIAIDGCVLHCVKRCLNNASVVPDAHVTLTDHGFRKRHHEACNEADLEKALSLVSPLLTAKT
ncbi:MAG: zinc-binding protein [Hahellaceae bacterium]|jgi:uncharacterized metal-binding protein|nr:zinc-binding protein [Hahellaceae bacterium]